jgi:hypothetical protein
MVFVPRGVSMPKLLSELRVRQQAYDAAVSFLVAQPGPAICETLILCYDAGKPYIFDPWNGTRLARLGKLDSNEIVKQIAEKKYGAFQTEDSVALKTSERFPEDVLYAVDRYYVEAFKRPDCHIYVPRVEPQGDLNPH